MVRKQLNFGRISEQNSSFRGIQSSQKLDGTMTEERRNDDGTISEEFRNKFEECETETLKVHVIRNGV